MAAKMTDSGKLFESETSSTIETFWSLGNYTGTSCNVILIFEFA